MFQLPRAILRTTARRQHDQLLLTASENDVRLHKNNAEVWSVRWSKVLRVVTYKADLFSMDLICLDFFLDSRPDVCATHEEIPGFPNLVWQLRVRFPSISEKWWSDVAFPAFATNAKILFERS